MLRGSIKKRAFYEPRPVRQSGQHAAPPSPVAAALAPGTAGDAMRVAQPADQAASLGQLPSEAPSMASSTAPPRVLVETHSQLGRAADQQDSADAPTHFGAVPPSPASCTATPATAQLPPLTLPALITQLEINTSADVLDVHHDAQDLEDLSDFVYLRACSVRFATNMAYTRSVGWQQRGTRTVQRWLRQATSVSLSCEAQDLGLVQPDRLPAPGLELAGLPPGRRLTHSSSAGRRTGDDLADSAASPAPPLPGFGEGLLLCASKLELRLAPRAPLHASRAAAAEAAGGLDNPTSSPRAIPPKRPLRMTVHDIQVYGGAMPRDTLVTLVMHLIAAFTRQARPGLPSPSPTLPTAPSMASTGAGDTPRGVGPAEAQEGLRGLEERPSFGKTGNTVGSTSAASRAGGPAAGRADSTVAGSARGMSTSNLAALPSQDAVAASEAALLAALLQARTARLQHAASAAAEQEGEQLLTPRETAAMDDPADVSKHSHHADDEEDPPNEEALHVTTSRSPHKQTESSPHRSEGSLHSAASTAAERQAAAAARGRGATLTGALADAEGGMQLVFEIEFTRLQVAVLPVNSPSTLLFATNNAVLTSKRHTATGARSLTASMSQLQAYAQRQPADGSVSAGHSWAGTGPVRGARVPWLVCADGRLQVPPGSSLCTVMNPFNLQITHNRAADGASADGLPQAPGSSQNLVVQVPDVEGALEPWQFEALLDVIQNVLMCPVPRACMLLPSRAPRPAVDSASSVVAAREVVSELGRSLCSMHQEAHVLAPGSMHAAWAQPVGGSADGFGFAPSSEQLLAALLATSFAPSSGPSAGGAAALARARSQSRELLLAWCLDQVSGAADALEAARAVLLREEAAAELLGARSGPRGGGARGGAAPLSATVLVGRFSWALSRAGGSVFLSAHLYGLEYTSALDGNYTGTTRLALRGLSVQEVLGGSSAPGSVTGSPGPVSGLLPTTPTPRHVLKLWQPRSEASRPNLSTFSGTSAASGALWDQQQQQLSYQGPAAAAATAADMPAWEYEYAFSMAAVHGGLEAPHFVVYDHLEVVLHPLELHFTYALAQSLQEYFALDESSSTAAGLQAGQGPLASGSAGFGGGAAASTAMGMVPALPTGTSTLHLPQDTLHLPLHLSKVHEGSASDRTDGTSPGRNWFPRRGQAAAAPSSAGSSIAGGHAQGPLASGAAHWSGPGGLPGASGAGPALPLARHSLSASVGGGMGGHAAMLSAARAADGVLMRSRALTADDVVAAAQPSRYGSVYRYRSRQLSARGMGASSASIFNDLAANSRGGKPRAGRRAERHSKTGGSTRHSAGTSLAGSTAFSQQQDAGAALSAIPRAQHSYRFKHVRFNRMHLKLTYEGPPINVTDFRVVLDHRVYQGLEGSWRTLLNKYKWDVVRSVLKSMAGMQKGKVMELEQGSVHPLLARALRAKPAAGGLRGADTDTMGGNLRQNLKALLGMGKGKGAKGADAALAAAGDLSVTSAGSAAMDDELLQAAEALRQRQARLVLLLGQVPPRPARKLLLEQEAEM